MKWWTDCCDQLFPGFKTPWLWVAQQCRSSTPPPTSRRGRQVAASFLDSRRGGNKCSLRGGKSVDQNRPPICRPLSKTVDKAAKRTGRLAAWCSVEKQLLIFCSYCYFMFHQLVGQDYFVEWTCCKDAEGHKSDFLGVPQGSILGPFLFSLHLRLVQKYIYKLTSMSFIYMLPLKNRQCETFSHYCSHYKLKHWV